MSTVLLLSGGMDSAVCLHYMGADVCLCFDYKQTNRIEIEYSCKLASAYDVEWVLRALPRIPLIDDVVYAARNAVLLSHSASYAMQNDHNTLMVGFNAQDANRFPDCTIDFVKAMNSAFSSYGVRIVAPLIGKTKSQIKHMANQLRASTWSCYTPIDGKNCGMCLACQLLED